VAKADGSIFDHDLACWALVRDGLPIATRTSRLLPVLRGRTRAMLKIAVHEEERAGAALLTWWDGAGAAHVLERAVGPRSLADLARSGHDDAASRIICDVVAKLHAPRPAPPPRLVPLGQWFEDLRPAAAVHGGILERCAAAAEALLSDPREFTPLHGDIHHGNILDFGACGWLAIDPKGLIGERGFDYANLFCNPDHETAIAPGRLARQIDVVAEAAGLEPRRLLQWVVAWAGLSAAFSLSDGLSPTEIAAGISD
jgi:streptomycin 6-kinase